MTEQKKVWIGIWPWKNFTVWITKNWLKSRPTSCKNVNWLRINPMTQNCCFYSGAILYPPEARVTTAIWHCRNTFCQWASYQIRKITGCACVGNAGNVFSATDFKRKQQVSDSGMHHGTYVTYVPWCMSGSLTRLGGENVPGIPGAYAPCNFMYLVRGPWVYSFQWKLRSHWLKVMRHRHVAVII